MNELILVLEENPEIQAVISASLKDSPIFINQELNPDFFLQQVQNLNPDLIFISNSDGEQNYHFPCLVQLQNFHPKICNDLFVLLTLMIQKAYEASR